MKTFHLSGVEDEGKREENERGNGENGEKRDKGQ